MDLYPRHESDPSFIGGTKLVVPAPPQDPPQSPVLYPSHRYHPGLKEHKFTQVEDAEQDGLLKASDGAWRDTPYSEEEHVLYAAENPGKQLVIPPPTPKVAIPSTVTTLDEVITTVEALTERVDRLEHGNKFLQ